MRLGHFEIYVNDVMKAKAFYENVLGFRLVVVQGDKYVWLERDGVEFLLKPERKAPRPPRYQEAGSGIVLYCDNLAKTRSELESKGLKFLGTDGSDHCLTFTDLDGNWFQLVEHTTEDASE